MFVSQNSVALSSTSSRVSPSGTPLKLRDQLETASVVVDHEGGETDGRIAISYFDPLEDSPAMKCSAIGVPANLSPSRRAKSNSDVRGR